jgi:hypothetical protein
MRHASASVVLFGVAAWPLACAHMAGGGGAADGGALDDDASQTETTFDAAADRANVDDAFQTLDAALAEAADAAVAPPDAPDAPDAADASDGGCNILCASGICGTTLAADMSEQPPNWSFNGAAVWDPAGPSARLTAAKTELVAGSVVYNHAIVTDSFHASYAFRIGANGGGQYDGMGFMLEVNGPTAIGSNGGGLGMSGLGGFGVELDVYNNGQCGDSNANHVGIDALGACGNGFLTSLFASPDLTGTVTLADAAWHTATVDLASGAMSVTVDGHAVANAPLAGFASGTSYYYGFAGAIGGGSGSLGMQTEVKDVTVTFPSPRCL